MKAKEKADLCVAAGRGWAEAKAEILRGSVPALDWPDLWDDAENPALPFAPHEIEERERRDLGQVASHSAHERWRELLTEQRDLEALEQEDHELEAGALRLEKALRDDAPPGITVGRDGSRVYLVNTATGAERTVDSLETAFRAIEDWAETRASGL